MSVFSKGSFVGFVIFCFMVILGLHLHLVGVVPHMGTMLLFKGGSSGNPSTDGVISLFAPFVGPLFG